jgi:hypothetical protein
MTAAPLEARAWAGIVELLEIVGAVIAARHAVEAAHGTPDEPAAVEALGDQLTLLEDAYGALRTINETASKDA